MRLLRECIRRLLSEASVLPAGEYEFPIVPYPQPGTEEATKDLEAVMHQMHDRVVPERLQGACDSNMQSLFEDYLNSRGLNYNSSYYDKVKDGMVPVIHRLKEFYGRPRPGDEAKRLGIRFRPDDLKSAKTASYPSGHTIQAYVLALLLSEQFPNEIDGLLDIAEVISQSRIDRGVHFPSDVDFGRKIAYLIVEEMLGESIT